METNEVHDAFEILLEEIEQVANEIHEEGAEAFRAGDYQEAQLRLEEATRLADFREKVKALQKEWSSIVQASVVHRKRRPGRTYQERLPRGLRTPEEKFRVPILEALVELGGSGKVGDVLDRVEQKMTGVLNQYDYDPLPSTPGSVRWRNTAQWCRSTMVREGLLKSDSPHGVWEISDRGRQWLREQQGML